MDRKRYVYAGNRSTVLRRMLALGLDVVGIFPTMGSWLDKEAATLKCPSKQVSTKKELVGYLEEAEFEVFVSTGCKFILPIAGLKAGKPEAVFVNVHPSPLPDLRGADPVPGAVLFARDSGVTCHLMDDGIDTGDIVASHLIKYREAFTATDLYEACFALEPDVFELAWKRDFRPIGKNSTDEQHSIYYSFQSGDNEFRHGETGRALVRRVRAFNTPSKGYRFSLGNKNFCAFGARLVEGGNSKSCDIASTSDQWTFTAWHGHTCRVSNGKESVELTNVVPDPDEDSIGLQLDIPLRHSSC